jgi:hypothetical protein
MACIGKIRSLCKKDDCEPCNKASFKQILKEKEIEHLYLYSKSNPPSHHLLPHSRSDIIMKCDSCRHEYPTKPTNITSGRGCPYCNKGKLCENVKTCSHCLPRCFLSSNRADYYIGENQPNIETITLRCNTLYKFKCPDCLHIIEKSPDAIFKGKWCDYCNPYGDSLCPPESDCKFCYEKSFASHPRSDYLYIENPRQYTLHSGKYTDFTCPDCNHSFNMRIADVTDGQWCPYCAWPTRRLCNQLPQCFHCYQRSIASHPLISYFDYKMNKNVPEFICMFSSEPIWLLCKQKHSFSITPAHLSEGRWCPKCYLKTEEKIYSWLCEMYETSDIIRQFKPDWCKNPENGSQLSYDFNIISKKVIIELDGNQHFIDIPSWKSKSNKVRNRDKLKMDYAIHNGYHIIRVIQEDIWYDRYDWRLEVFTLLSNLPENPSRIFMCKLNEYDIYKT